MLHNTLEFDKTFMLFLPDPSIFLTLKRLNFELFYILTKSSPELFMEKILEKVELPFSEERIYP